MMHHELMIYFVAKIGVFYLVFYSCLAGFFAAMMAIFYQTLDTETSPKFAFGQSILKNPGKKNERNKKMCFEET